jgi:hypothetical protein
MKNLLAAALIAACSVASAQMASGTPVQFNGTGTFTYQDDFTTNGGPVTVVFQGGETWKCTSGHPVCVYNFSDLTELVVSDSNGVVLCDTTQRVTVRSGGGYAVFQMSCALPSVAAGTYTIAAHGNGFYARGATRTPVAEPYQLDATF